MEKLIRKLSIVVTEKCNFHCKYCYVWRCQVSGDVKTMSMSTADGIINYCIQNYTDIQFVQFFGGEPTMNIAVIGFIVGELNSAADKGLINKKPRYGIVTNGSSTEEVIQFLRDNDIEITVSIDGPEFIHDKQRVFNNDKPTHKQVVGFINDIQLKGLDCTVELVYTTNHILEEFSILDAFKYCLGLGVKKIIFQCAYPPAPAELIPINEEHIKTLLAYYNEAIEWWFESIIHFPMYSIDVYFKDILRCILEGVATVTEDGCPAGIRDISIGPDANIYACQLNYGSSDFRIGSIYGDNKESAVIAFPNCYNDFIECRNCFARFWCQPCSALNHYWGNKWILPETECKIRRFVIQKIGQLAFENFSIPVNELTSLLADVGI